MHDSELPVVIVGAGPYGLSIAAHIKAMGIHFRIFGPPMRSWREQMPRGMHLKSEGFASSLYDPEDSFTLGKYCQDAALPYADVGDPVPIERFVDYGLEFQRRLVPQLEPQEIKEIRRQGQSFLVTTSQGEVIRARNVVVAAGITHFGYLPPELERYPAELVSHSSAHADLAGFRGKTVAVLGAGSSAIDIAALLHEAGAHVHVIARRPAIAFHEPPEEPRSLMTRILAPRSGLGTGWRSRLCTDLPLVFHAMPESIRLRVVKRHLGPAPGWFIKERVVGRFPIHLSTTIGGIRAQDGRLTLELAGPSGAKGSIPADHLIAATGYKPVVQRLPFLEQGLCAQIRTLDEGPVLSRQFESSVRGLYFVGLASANSFGPLARFAYGAGFTARRLSRHLADVLRFPVPAALTDSSTAVS